MTLMEMLMADLDNRGERTLFLNLDIEWDRPQQENVPKSLRSFIDRYRPAHADTINRDYRNTLKIDKTTLHFLAFQDLLHQATIF